jgi:hypothetical protein
MRNWEDFEPDNDVQLVSSGPLAPPGLSSPKEEVGGAYMTVSQQASERELRQVAQKRELLASSSKTSI